jgi:hypothetical protein
MVMRICFSLTFSYDKKPYHLSLLINLYIAHAHNFTHQTFTPDTMRRHHCHCPNSQSSLTHEGEGQFNRMIIRGVNVINGTGSPMQGLVILLSRKTKSHKSR